MLFAVRFYDRPDRLDVRKHQMEQHLEWLLEHGDVILVGGSLRSDPFWIHGLRERYDIHSWHKAFPAPTAI